MNEFAKHPFNAVAMSPASTRSCEIGTPIIRRTADRTFGRYNDGGVDSWNEASEYAEFIRREQLLEIAPIPFTFEDNYQAIILVTVPMLDFCRVRIPSYIGGEQCTWSVPVNCSDEFHDQQQTIVTVAPKKAGLRWLEYLALATNSAIDAQVNHFAHENNVIRDRLILYANSALRVTRSEELRLRLYVRICALSRVEQLVVYYIENIQDNFRTHITSHTFCDMVRNYRLEHNIRL